MHEKAGHDNAAWDIALPDGLVKAEALDALDSACFELGLNPEKWPPSGKVDKIRDLLRDRDQAKRIGYVLGSDGTFTAHSLFVTVSDISV
jgi:hypothetical protein